MRSLVTYMCEVVLILLVTMTFWTYVMFTAMLCPMVWLDPEKTSFTYYSMSGSSPVV